MTGVSNLLVALVSKQLGLLRELVPGTTAIAALMNPNFAGAEKELGDVEAAARILGLQLIVLRAGTEREIETAFATIAQQGVHALLVGIDPFLTAQRNQIVALAARHAIPANYPTRDFVEDGGLVSYGHDISEAVRQAAVYVGRVLKGEKPADLPVQQPTKYELVINLKTARALGLTVSDKLLARADEVIE